MVANVLGVPVAQERRVYAGKKEPTLLLVCDGLVAMPVAYSAVGSLTGATLVGTMSVTARWFAGLYRPQFSRSGIDEFPHVAIAGVTAVGVMAVLHALVPAVGRAFVISTFWVVLALMLTRFGALWILRALRRSGRLHTHVLIVGHDDVAELLERQAVTSADLGIEVCGRISTLGSGDVTTMIRGYGADCVFIAGDGHPDRDQVPAIRTLLEEGVAVYTVPRYFDLLSQGRADGHVWRIPLIRLGSSARPGARRAKRAFDIALAGIALLLTAPVIILAGWLVRRETGAGMLFRQDRIGQGGASFELLKLQTMKPQTALEGQTRWNISQDERLGSVGRFLRKTSIDELPQLWNIVRGDMSLVGPRPERPYYVAKFSAEYPHYADRHRMPVGLTGLAQIHGMRGDTCISERASFDNQYIDNWSFWQDVKIVIQTVPSVLKGAGG